MINPRAHPAPADGLPGEHHQATRSPAATPRTPRGSTTVVPRGSTTPARPSAASSPRRPRAEEEDEAGAGPSGLQLNASTSRVALTPEQQHKERKIKKRRKSIQRFLNSRVMEEAETEARLGESKKEETIFLKEIQLYKTRREGIRLQRTIEAARRNNVLQVMGNSVQESLNRLNFARETLEEDNKRKVEQVEDAFSREEAAHVRDLERIDAEEKATRNSHRLSIIDYEVFHARNVEQAGERLVEAIQASENEEMPSEDEEEEDDESYEDEEDDEISEDEGEEDNAQDE